MTESTKPDGKVKIEIPAGEYEKSKSASGNLSRHNGDVVASALAGLPLNAVVLIASAMTDTSAEDLTAKYQHLNPGQQRMNLGNRIRGAVNKMNKHADSELGRSEDAVSGDDYLEQIAEPHQHEAKEQAKAATAKKEQEAKERGAALAAKTAKKEQEAKVAVEVE